MKIKPESLPEGDAIKIIAIAKEEFIIYEYFLTLIIIKKFIFTMS